MSDNTVIQIKRSDESGNTPNSSILNYGELAINYADGLLFYKNSLNQIRSIRTQDVFESINVGGNLLLPTSPSDILTINSANGIVLTACTLNDTIVIGENLTPIINIAFTQANAAYDHANAAYNAANTGTGTFANSAYDQANTANATAQAAFNQANTANTLAQAAFDVANSSPSSSSDYFPINDYGYLSNTSIYQTLGDELTYVMYDMSDEPITPRGFFLTKDLGFLT